MRMLYTLVAATFSVAAQAATDCVAERSSARPHLVELYTSEGCSSCPPADDWLRRIPAPSNIVALAFHVDYWDYLGWHDRFSESRFTTRQQEQASRDHAGGIYTPQVVLDGHSWTNWYRGSLPASPSTAAATMRVTTTSGARLRVHVDTTMDNAADATGFRNYIALTEDGLSSQVGAGENRGVLLHHIMSYAHSSVRCRWPEVKPSSCCPATSTRHTQVLSHLHNVRATAKLRRC